MSHIAFQPRGRHTVIREADWVVVGSGAGGSAVAVGLARGGEDVLIVEAGPWRDPADYPSSVYGAMRDMLYDWGGTVTRGGPLWPVIQAQCVGGTTVVNSAIVVRTPGDIFEAWQRDYGIGGGWAEDFGRLQDQLEAELNVEPVPEAARGLSNTMAQQAAERIGIEGHVIDRNVKDCIGSGQCLQGCKAERKQSTNLNYIPEVIELGGSVLSCAPVDRVTMADRRAVGVSGRFLHPQTKDKGANFEVRARKGVILAASVTHTPGLLTRSGIESPAIGKRFMSHPGTGIFGCYDDRIEMHKGATQGWASVEHRINPGLKLETLSLPAELMAGRLSGGGAALTRKLEQMPHMAMWIAAVWARSEGTVRRGWGGRPVVRYKMDKADMERQRFGVHEVARMHFAMGAKAIVPGVYGMPYTLGPDEVDKLLEAPLNPKCWTAVMSHLFGGCVMGQDAATSVCDANGWVHGYKSLMVADASAFPSNIGVNPQHSIMALGLLRAEQLLQEVS